MNIHMYIEQNTGTEVSDEMHDNKKFNAVPRTMWTEMEIWPYVNH